jgi:hypothetical protein
MAAHHLQFFYQGNNFDQQELLTFVRNKVEEFQPEHIAIGILDDKTYVYVEVLEKYRAKGHGKAFWEFQGVRPEFQTYITNYLTFRKLFAAFPWRILHWNYRPQNPQLLPLPDQIAIEQPQIQQQQAEAAAEITKLKSRNIGSNLRIRELRNTLKNIEGLQTEMRSILSQTKKLTMKNKLERLELIQKKLASQFNKKIKKARKPTPAEDALLKKLRDKQGEEIRLPNDIRPTFKKIDEEQKTTTIINLQSNLEGQESQSMINKLKDNLESINDDLSNRNIPHHNDNDENSFELLKNPEKKDLKKLKLEQKQVKARQLREERRLNRTKPSDSDEKKLPYARSSETSRAKKVKKD